MTVEVFGVDQTFVESYYPQLLIGATSKLTPARMTEIVEGGAARVGGVLEAQFGAGTVDEIALDPTDLVYRNCQGLTVRQIGAELLAASHGHTAVDGYEDLVRMAEDEMDRLQRNPSAMTGRTTDTSYFPSVTTSTGYRNLDTSVTALRGSRLHDGRNARSGKDQGGYIW
jgi:hypothetical protein